MSELNPKNHPLLGESQEGRHLTYPLTDTEKIQAWRMLSLLRTFAESTGQLADEDDVTALGVMANSNSDLQDMRRALERGCDLGTALSIFC